MICPKCHAETDGIKINNYLYCSSCGEKIQEVEVRTLASNADNREETPQPKVIHEAEAVEEEIDTLGAELSTIDLITEAGERLEQEKELATLEAEEEVLELLEKKPLDKLEINPLDRLEAKKPTKKEKPLDKLEAKKEIVKHNRNRADHHYQKDFLMIPGEPDPFDIPELISPKDDMITAPQAPKSPDLDMKLPETERFPLVEKDKIKEIKAKREKHQKVLTSFLKEGASQASKVKKNRKKKKFLLIFLPVVTAILVVVGLVAFINLYVLDTNRVIKKAEESVSFNYKKPNYLPYGYELSSNTNGTKEEISYAYNYLPDPKQTINITIKKSDLGEKEVFDTYVGREGNTYKEFTKDGTTYWTVNEKEIYFKNQDLLYLIKASDKIGTEELLKIAQGML